MCKLILIKYSMLNEELISWLKLNQEPAPVDDIQYNSLARNNFQVHNC